MAETDFSDLIPKSNPRTAEKHRREVLLQIYLPLGIAILIAIAVCLTAAVAVFSGGGGATWVDISLIWLILLSLALWTIPLVVLIALVVGLFRINDLLPGLFYRVQKLFAQLSHRVQLIADKSVEPVLKTGAFAARLRVLRSGRRRG